MANCAGLYVAYMHIHMYRDLGVENRDLDTIKPRFQSGQVAATVPAINVINNSQYGSLDKHNLNPSSESASAILVIILGGLAPAGRS